MSDTSTLVDTAELADDEVRQLLVKAIRNAEEPRSLAQILNDIPQAVRPTEDFATALIQEQIRAGHLFTYPAIRGRIQFWHQPQTVYARRLLLRNVERGPKRQSDLLREVGKLSPIKGLNQAELKRVFESLQHEGLIHKLKPYIGTRTFLFSATPADPRDYMKDAVQKLSKILGISEQELFDSYQPTANLPVDDKRLAVSQVESKPQVSVAVDGNDERIVEAMKELDPRVAEGAMVSIADLRRQLSIHLAGEEFDRALLNESAAGIVAIHLFDRPFLVSDEERRLLLRDEQGNYYNTVSLRRS